MEEAASVLEESLGVSVAKIFSSAHMLEKKSPGRDQILFYILSHCEDMNNSY